jgi:hypothetical protein
MAGRLASSARVGLKLSHGVAAWLRHPGVPAEVLEGGTRARLVQAALRLAPEAAGLLAASPGLSPMFAEDLPQLEAGMLRYDAFYRRDGR